MLILDRKIGETIDIGNNIEIEILKIGSSRVTVGIRAPISVNIKRHELQKSLIEKAVTDAGGDQ